MLEAMWRPWRDGVDVRLALADATLATAFHANPTLPLPALDLPPAVTSLLGLGAAAKATRGHAALLRMRAREAVTTRLAVGVATAVGAGTAAPRG